MSHQLKKNQEICNQLVKRKRKPTVKCCNVTITESAQYKVGPITKIKSPVGSILQKFRLTGSSGNLVGTRFPDEPVRRNISRIGPTSDLIYIYIYIFWGGGANFHGTNHYFKINNLLPKSLCFEGSLDVLKNAFKILKNYFWDCSDFKNTEIKKNLTVIYSTLYGEN